MDRSRALAAGVGLWTCVITLCCTLPSSLQRVTVDNGVRYTTSGQRIDAHSGTLLAAPDGNFYWYGEAYACGFRWQDPATSYCGADDYRSPDLVHWQGPWPLFDAASDYWQNLCMHQAGRPGGGCFRPKVAYNRTTRQYVLWINTPERGANSYRVLVSPNPTGPFRLVGRPELFDAGMTDWTGSNSTFDGDQGLFVDRDGSGWLVWNRGGRLLQERLDDTYTSGSESPGVILNYPEIPPYGGVESPSEFEHDGRYYIAMSMPRCPYCSGTTTAIEESPHVDGPWTYQGIVSPTSCAGQPNEVDEVSPGVLLWSSDQWIRDGAAGVPPRLNETYATQDWERLTFTGAAVGQISCTPAVRVPLAVDRKS